MTEVKYKDLKNAIIKSCLKVGNRGNDFKIDITKLNSSLENQNLVALPVGLKAEKAKPENMFAVAEYFLGEHLRWFDDSKYITTLILLDGDDITEDVQKSIDMLYVSPEDDPDIDYVEIVSDLVATLHAYFAMVVSYNSNDPGRSGKNTYYINCRANKVVIKDPGYNYNPKDM